MDDRSRLDYYEQLTDIQSRMLSDAMDRVDFWEREHRRQRDKLMALRRALFRLVQSHENDELSQAVADALAAVDLEG